jgi:hypothetical protein
MLLFLQSRGLGLCSGPAFLLQLSLLLLPLLFLAAAEVLCCLQFGMGGGGVDGGVDRARGALQSGGSAPVPVLGASRGLRTCFGFGLGLGFLGLLPLVCFQRLSLAPLGLFLLLLLALHTFLLHLLVGLSGGL